MLSAQLFGVDSGARGPRGGRSLSAKQLQNCLGTLLGEASEEFDSNTKFLGLVFKHLLCLILIAKLANQGLLYLPALNKMLETARRNLDGADLVRVMDDDIGVVNFLRVTKQDITASGKIRPIGARHFAAQATMVQNFMGFMSSPVGQDESVKVHLSGKAIAKAMEDLLGLGKFSIYQENARVFEMKQVQALMQAAGEDNEVAAATPIDAPATPDEAVE